jgi:RNA polymerase-binding transcription factor DksA
MEEDFIERATALADMTVTNGIDRARIRDQRPNDFEGQCKCGNEIPEARSRLGYFSCVSCQEKKERLSRLFK